MSTDNIPRVTVGIVCAQRIEFCLNGTYRAKGKTVSGPQTVELSDGALLYTADVLLAFTFCEIMLVYLGKLLNQ